MQQLLRFKLLHIHDIYTSWLEYYLLILFLIIIFL